MLFPATHISISINCSPREVYTFASNPENLPEWAAGLANNVVSKKDDYWTTNSPMGVIKIKYAPLNEFGVMDHDVTLPSGETNHNPFRVMKNDSGSEVVFTLFKLPNMTEDDFQRDKKLVQADLQKLKQLLEK
ncbi:MAG: SRPBCC family protein [Bacteriovoracaceae bacterium]